MQKTGKNEIAKSTTYPALYFDFGVNVVLHIVTIHFIILFLNCSSLTRYKCEKSVVFIFSFQMTYYELTANKSTSTDKMKAYSTLMIVEIHD